LEELLVFELSFVQQQEAQVLQSSDSRFPDFWRLHKFSHSVTTAR